MRILIGAFVGEIKINVAHISNRTMHIRHKAQIFIRKCAHRWCQLYWTKQFTISKVNVCDLFHLLLLVVLLWIDNIKPAHFLKIKLIDVTIYLMNWIKCDFRIYSASINKIYSHWSSGARKGRMNGQVATTLDPSITQSLLMNSYSSANHDVHSIATRNGN